MRFPPGRGFGGSQAAWGEPKGVPCSPAGSWDKALDVSDFGPSHIINIKKEKRETDEETKQILRRLQKDDVSGGFFRGTGHPQGAGAGAELRPRPLSPPRSSWTTRG